MASENACLSVQVYRFILLPRQLPPLDTWPLPYPHPSAHCKKTMWTQFPWVKVFRIIPDFIGFWDFLCLAKFGISGFWNLDFRISGCSKWIANFYPETSNFKLAQTYLFHAPEVLPVARNAKFQPMYPLLEGVTVRWFGHSNKVLMNGRSKCLSGLVFAPSKECFQFRKQKEITWGKVWGIRGVRQNSYFFFLQKRRNYCGGMSWGIVM